MKKIGKYSFGLGDRFGHQGRAQLKAIMTAEKKGVEITPVWNKSNREHIIIGTHPGQVRHEAAAAVNDLNFKRSYFVDADHVNSDTVDRFIDSSDFFTVDVASCIGKRARSDEINAFVANTSKYTGELKVPGIKNPMKVSKSMLEDIAEKYLFAVFKAGEIYRKIEKAKGRDNFVTEVSMDEVPAPQTPVELFFILKMMGDHNIPLQTIAPKFSGRFNKGVDYVGDPDDFAAEFEADLLVTDLAIKEFDLPGNLKLSIHSGSDKFSLYTHIGSLMRKHDKGIHIKTAGTTWLEEYIGLAEAGGGALDFVKEIYVMSLHKMEELCAPYADVIDIKATALPTVEEVKRWNGKKMAAAVRHIPDNPHFIPDMRQLIHVSYKLAAMNMEKFTSLLNEHEEVISKGVFENIYTRHICRLFGID